MVIRFHWVSFFTGFLHPTSIPLSRATHHEIAFLKEIGVTNHISLLNTRAPDFRIIFLFKVQEEAEAWIPGTKLQRSSTSQLLNLGQGTSLSLRLRKVLMSDTKVWRGSKNMWKVYSTQEALSKSKLP